MTTEIPKISYNPKYAQVEGVDIITIESLIKRKDDLDLHPGVPHRLGFHMLVLYTEGETEQFVDFVWHKVVKNTLLYIGKGQVNAFKFNENLKGILFIFSESYFKEQLNKMPKDTAIRLFTSNLFSPKIQIPISSNVLNYMELFHDEFSNNKEEFNKKNILDHLYIVLFSKLEQLKKYQTISIKESGKLEFFLEFKTLLEQNFTKSRNADFYAQRMNITYKHLNTICKEIVDVTAKQFIDEFIVLEAKRKLINSSIKSTELAYSLGFEEPSNFVKYFKKNTGLTPNSFKKLHR